MDLDTLIGAAYCLIDEHWQRLTDGRRVRRLGPNPLLSDSEVLAMEVVGELLGLDQDRAVYDYFRRHYAAWFPALGRVHRTTFTRQAANPWRWKERLWQALALQAPHDPSVAPVGSFPVPVCRFARAHRRQLFPGGRLRPRRGRAADL